MIKITDAFADFQYIGHRILSFSYAFPVLKETERKYEYLMDYNVAICDKKDDKHFGVICVEIKINEILEDDTHNTLSMEIDGAFVGNPNVLSEEQFRNMLEINGVATLSHIARTQIMNVTSMSGANERIVLPMINIIEIKAMKDLDQKS